MTTGICEECGRPANKRGGVAGMSRCRLAAAAAAAGKRASQRELWSSRQLETQRTVNRFWSLPPNGYFSCFLGGHWWRSCDVRSRGDWQPMTIMLVIPQGSTSLASNQANRKRQVDGVQQRMGLDQPDEYVQSSLTHFPRRIVVCRSESRVEPINTIP